MSPLDPIDPVETLTAMDATFNALPPQYQNNYLVTLGLFEQGLKVFSEDDAPGLVGVLNAGYRGSLTPAVLEKRGTRIIEELNDDIRSDFGLQEPGAVSPRSDAVKQLLYEMGRGLGDDAASQKDASGPPNALAVFGPDLASNPLLLLGLADIGLERLRDSPKGVSSLSYLSAESLIRLGLQNLGDLQEADLIGRGIRVVQSLDPQTLKKLGLPASLQEQDVEALIASVLAAPSHYDPSSAKSPPRLQDLVIAGAQALGGQAQPGASLGIRESLPLFQGGAGSDTATKAEQLVKLSKALMGLQAQPHGSQTDIKALAERGETWGSSLSDEDLIRMGLRAVSSLDGPTRVKLNLQSLGDLTEEGPEFESLFVAIEDASKAVQTGDHLVGVPLQQLVELGGGMSATSPERPGAQTALTNVITRYTSPEQVQNLLRLGLLQQGLADIARLPPVQGPVTSEHLINIGAQKTSEISPLELINQGAKLIGNLQPETMAALEVTVASPDSPVPDAGKVLDGFDAALHHLGPSYKIATMSCKEILNSLAQRGEAVGEVGVLPLAGLNTKAVGQLESTELLATHAEDPISFSIEEAMERYAHTP
jgi:hypothetical protein